MKHSLRKILPTLLAGGAIVGLAGPASATNTMHGGCSVYIQQDPTAPDHYYDMMGENSTTQDANGAPVDATVWCELLIDGIETTSNYYDASGAGSQSGWWLDSFSLPSATSTIQLCQWVAYSGGSPSPKSCRLVTVGFTPPPP